MAAIGKVSAVFTASTSGLTAGVKAASSAFGSLRRDTSGLESAMRSLVAINAAQLFGQVASGAANAVRSLVSMGQAQSLVIDQTSKMASRLGMTYGEFAGLTLAAQSAGVSLEVVGQASTKAEIAFAKAASGSVASTAAFDRLGLSVDKLNGLSAAERFDLIASAIADLPTEAERATASIGVFGKSGLQLLPIFSDGAEGIKKARGEAEKFGLALTTAQGKDVVGMQAAFESVDKVLRGVTQQVVAYLSPALAEAARAFTELTTGIGAANLGQAIGDGILEGARVLAQIGDFLVSGLAGVWEYISGVGSQWAQHTASMQQVAAAFAAVFKGASAAFLLVVRGLTAPFAFVIEKLAGLVALLPGAAGDFGRQVAAGVQGFRDGLDASISSQVEALGSSLDFATSINPRGVGQAIAGPLTTALDGAIARAGQSAAQIDTAAKTPVTITQEIVVDASEAIKGIDSRSTEGIAEMFRIMRGGAGDLAQRQLDALEQIVDNTAGGDGILVQEF